MTKITGLDVYAVVRNGKEPVTLSRLRIYARPSAEFLARPGGHKALAERILHLASDAELRARLGAANRLRIEREFSPRQMCKGTLVVIENELGAAPKCVGTADARLRKDAPA